MSLHTATKIPAITQIRGLPPLAVMALQAIKETIEVREGLHEPLDRFVSVRELADLILEDEEIVSYLGSGHSHDNRYYTKTQWDLDAKGDLNVAQSAGVPGTLAVGTSNQLIRADAGATLGIEYFSLLGTSNQVTVTHNALDATLSLPQDIHSGASPTFTALTLSAIPAGVADYDKFLVSDGGVLKYRTGAEVLSDIGAGSGGGDAFKTITGITNDVVADLAEDTLTLAVGNNKLSILGAAATNTITFTVNEGNIDHNGLLNTHNLTTDINHATITGAHNLTTDIDHATITNTHNLTTDIDHNQTSNLTVGDAHTQYLNITRHDTTTRHTLGTVVPHDALSLLTDTSVGTPSNDDVLTYKTASGKWEAHAGSGSGVTDHGALTGLGDSADHAWALLVDGTRPLTGDWNIGNFKLGINTVPTSPLHINHRPGDETISTAYIDIDPTGTLTAFESHAGFDLNIHTTVNRNANPYLVTGLKAGVYTSGAADVTSIYGLSFDAQHNAATTLGDLYSVFIKAQAGGGPVTKLYGAKSELYVSSSGSASSVYGFDNQISMSAAGNTLSTAYSHKAKIIQSAGTITTGYLFYGEYSGTIGTKWGIYLFGETKSYLSGYLGIGDSTNTEKLNVAGNLMLSGDMAVYIKTAVDDAGYSNIYLQGAGTGQGSVVAIGTGATSRGAIYASYGGAYSSNHIQMHHNGTDGYLNTGAGDLKLFPNSGQVHIYKNSSDDKLIMGHAGTWGVAIQNGSATVGSALYPMIFSASRHASAYGSFVFRGRDAVGTEMLVIDDSGNVGINTTSPSGKLDINSDIFRLRTAKTPATAGAAGNAGDICWDASNIYVCVATNTWKKIGIATW